MQVTLTIIRYPKKYIPFALLAMALHRFPLWFDKNTRFFKLLGCGKNGTFDKHPDWQQWGILSVRSDQQNINDLNERTLPKTLYGSFISNWFRLFNCETWTIFLEPLEGHGKWDGKEPFGPLSKQAYHQGPIAILTRATIRIARLKAFWQNVDAVANQMTGAEGFIHSIGIGEMPYIKQATFSIWENRDSMKQFAYRQQAHQDVIKKTRQEKWYSEEMFVRFKPLKTIGSIKGIDPLKGKL